MLGPFSDELSEFTDRESARLSEVAIDALKICACAFEDLVATTFRGSEGRRDCANEVFYAIRCVAGAAAKPLGARTCRFHFLALSLALSDGFGALFLALARSHGLNARVFGQYEGIAAANDVPKSDVQPSAFEFLRKRRTWRESVFGDGDWEKVVLFFTIELKEARTVFGLWRFVASLSEPIFGGGVEVFFGIFYPRNFVRDFDDFVPPLKNHGALLAVLLDAQFDVLVDLDFQSHARWNEADLHG